MFRHWTVGASLLLGAAFPTGPLLLPPMQDKRLRTPPPNQDPRRLLFQTASRALVGDGYAARLRSVRHSKTISNARRWDPTGASPAADWHIEAGRLCVKGARNHGAWLARMLPTNVRIEFDAVSNSPEGDIKAEIFGDGASAASSVSLQRRHQLPRHLRRVEKQFPRPRAHQRARDGSPRNPHHARLG